MTKNVKRDTESNKVRSKWTKNSKPVVRTLKNVPVFSDTKTKEGRALIESIDLVLLWPVMAMSLVELLLCSKIRWSIFLLFFLKRGPETDKSQSKNIFDPYRIQSTVWFCLLLWAVIAMSFSELLLCSKIRWSIFLLFSTFGLLKELDPKLLFASETSKITKNIFWPL